MYFDNSRNENLFGIILNLKENWPKFFNLVRIRKAAAAE